MYTAGITTNGKSEKLVKEKLLTVGIITKNECEKLERCLKSLMPLKDAINCEIIVTDTGSTDGTIEMAEKYADKIINFEWCDDFAAARNSGIDAAQGLWFMWVDSDEWFENVDKIITFFKSEEYKKYISATLTFIDYRDIKKKNYSELTVFRMTVMHSGVKFIGEIHESVNITTPTKKIDTKLYHDGYVFESEKEKISKHQRNLDALMTVYEKNPNRLGTISYIVDQYNFIGDFEKVDEYCQKGIAISKELEDKTSKSHHLNFLIMQATNFLNTGRNAKAVELLENLKDEDDENSYRFLDIYAVLSNAYFNLDIKDKAFEYAKKFMDYYINQDKLNQTNACIFILIFSQTNVINTMLFRCIKYFVNQKMSEVEIFDYLEQIKLNMISTDSENGILDYTKNIIKTALELRQYGLIIKLYKHTESDNQMEIASFENILILELLNYKECVEDIIREVADLDIESEFNQFAKIIEKHQHLDDEEFNKADLQNWVDSYEHIKNKYIQTEIIYFAIEHNLDLSLVIEKLDVYNIIEIVKNPILVHPDFLEKLINYYYENIDFEFNTKKLYFIIALMEYYTVNRDSSAEVLIVYDIFETELPKLINSMYSKEILKDINICLLPNLFRFGYYIQNANIYKQKNDYVSYIKTLKTALREYPIMEIPIKNAIKDIEIYLEEADSRTKELENLAKNIKQKIYEFITMGNNEEALSVICQLQSIMPHDNELKELKSRLTLKK